MEELASVGSSALNFCPVKVLEMLLEMFAVLITTLCFPIVTIALGANSTSLYMVKLQLKTKKNNSSLRPTSPIEKYTQS